MVYICGVAPAVFHSRPWVKPVTTVAVLEWVWCTQLWVRCVKIYLQCDPCYTLIEEVAQGETTVELGFMSRDE